MSVEQVRLPDLGEGLTEATIVRWLVMAGDVIDEDQIVAEVETAKATVELPAPHAGTVAELHAVEGEEVDVGAPVLSVDTSAGATTAANGTPPEPPAAGGGTETGDQPGATAAVSQVDDDADESATESEVGDDESGNVLVGYGTSGRRARRRRTRIAHDAAPARSRRPRAKPPVRKLAKDLGVDLDAVDGSGPDGRIMRDDVHAAADVTPDVSARAAMPSSASRDGERREAVTGVRGRIADHLSVAWREIPAASCWVECDATELLAVRRELVAAHPDARLTPLSVVLRCCAVALAEVPQLNASFDAQAREIVHHQRIDLGVATQTDRGLLVPVVRDAGNKSVLELADAVERLATGARANRLPPADLVGSTFTVSNFGAYGIDGGGPIINHPEAGILGIGRIASRPWVVDDAVVPRAVVALSLSFDHRVCDGAEAAGFLRLLADLVEQPTRLLAY